jgi:4-diphosphocytidyl-2-C-methyl-D-erythritol kinase
MAVQMETLRYQARAKINLGLDVCRRLDNGYHEVKMVMQTVDIYDELEFKKRNDSEIILSINSRDNLGDVTNNLIYKAAKLMRETYGINEGIEIKLTKNIPVAAGMAGGSTDAAATMLALNEMFNLRLTKLKIMEDALKLGADIPFCVLGGTALAEGIGEDLSELPAPPKASILVVKPPINVSTKWVYEQLDAKTLDRHPNIDAMVEALHKGDLKGITDNMENVLETVTIAEYPIISDIKKMMVASGAINALMSGSGPSIFGIFRDEKQANAAAVYIDQTLRTKGINAYTKVTEFYND